MANAPFKMKGFSGFGNSPAPTKQRSVVEEYASGEKTTGSDKRSAEELEALSKKASDAGSQEASDKLLAKATKKRSDQQGAKDYLEETA